MPLLDTATGLSRATLDEIYREHREGIADTASMLEGAWENVTDPARRLLAMDLARDALRVLPESTASLDAAEAIDRTNLTYDLMIALIEMAKMSLDVPKVPRSKKS